MEYNFRVVDTKGTPIPNIKVSSQWQSNGDYVYDWYGKTYYQSLSIGDVVITDNGDAYVMLTSGEWINYPVTRVF